MMPFAAKAGRQMLTMKAGRLHSAQLPSQAEEARRRPAGSIETSSCTCCDASYRLEDVDGLFVEGVAECRMCCGLVKPDVVLFGELLPERAMAEAHGMWIDIIDDKRAQSGPNRGANDMIGTLLEAEVAGGARRGRRGPTPPVAGVSGVPGVLADPQYEAIGTIATRQSREHRPVTDAQVPPTTTDAGIPEDATEAQGAVFLGGPDGEDA